MSNSGTNQIMKAYGFKSARLTNLSDLPYSFMVHAYIFTYYLTIHKKWQSQVFNIDLLPYKLPALWVEELRLPRVEQARK